ncbi:MAG TPA: nuclear transport factor 2 family protein [Solirubrobacteraceae bacterium]|nr:nuclear transport factor 2 family protein [Solirubrobacteraceae bacterium]
MSRENVELVRRAYEAFAAEDRDAIKELLAPDVVWYPALGLLLEQSIYHGPEAVCRLLFEEIPEVLEGFQAELLELHDLGDDAVLAIARFSGRTGGAEVEQTFGQLFRGRDSRTYRMDSYPSRREALEAVGLGA